MAKEAPPVSIVVVTFNGRRLGDVLDACLGSLLETRYPSFEVLVVDNGSKDNTAAYVHTRYSDKENLHVLALNSNLGFGGGSNEGVRKSDIRGEFIVFVNPDVIVPRGWLGPLVEAMLNSPAIGACGPVELSASHASIDKAGSFCSIGGATIPLHTVASSEPYQVSYADGACLMTRRSIFEQLSGFNQKYFLYYEDTDFCERLWSFGFASVVVPSSNVVHLGGTSVDANRLRPKALYHSSRNVFYYLFQNKIAKDLVPALMMALLHNASMAAGAIVRGEVKCSLSIMRGTIVGFLSMKHGVARYGRRPTAGGPHLPLSFDILSIFDRRPAIQRVIQTLLLRRVVGSGGSRV
ncbi:MAG: glycosyltransferase family 2 protein [Nitrososphaerota archaeon]|nr:glycosyltransferase family 2 protein [Nitrososphaerota archaeon]